MPDFNIKNSWGQKVGSIEEKGPGVLDVIAQMQHTHRMFRSAERTKLVEETYNDLSVLSSHLGSMTSLAEIVNLHNEVNTLITSLLRSWLDGMERTPFGQSERNVDKYHKKVMLPLSDEIRENVLSIYPTLEVFTKLEGLLNLINQYLFFHNESCDRVEAQGLFEIEISDQVFISLNENWSKELDRLIEFHTETASLAARLDGVEAFESIQEDVDELFDKLPELQAHIDNLVNLTNGREKAAERVLANHGKSQSPASFSDELVKLAEMRNSGILTQDEFEMAKKKLLS